MGLYDDWKQPQLQAEASKRGLSAGGTNAELMARLEEDDTANDLLGDAGAAPASEGEAAVSTLPADYADYLAWKQSATKADPTPAAAPVEDDQPKKKTHIVRYEVRGELSTSMNDDNRMRAYQDAIDHGLAPRGGMAGVCRIGWEHGMSVAVYEVTLQR